MMLGKEKGASLCSSQDWLNYGVRAVFSDETEQFRTPFEPECGDEVTIRIRTWKNSVEKAELVWDNSTCPMELVKSEGSFDYYESKRIVGESSVSYYFCLYRNGKLHYYNKGGLNRTKPDFGDFLILPGFHTPKWARGAVMYQIFTDRFCNGDPDNDVGNREYFYDGGYSRFSADWHKAPDADAIREFYGGDLQGIMDKLDYLQDLGVEVLYLNPIFVSPSNHKYDIQDYENVDPHFGKIVKDCGQKMKAGDHDNRHAKQYIRRVTDRANLDASNQLLADLTAELHKRGMRIILDGVFNHCGSYNKWLDREIIYSNEPGYEKGAFVSKDSPYHSYFHFEKDNWPNNTSYESWWGFVTLPKLNFEGSKELEEHILKIGKKWVSAPYNADGWRLDVAADLGHTAEYNHSFWRKYRQAVKDANPEAIILAEHYGDPSAWLQGDQWDTVMNYDAFMEPVTWFLTGMEKHSDDYRPELLGNGKYFNDTMIRNMAKFTCSTLQCAMNELSNHDHSRFYTRTNHVAGRAAQLGAEAAGEDLDKAIFQLAVLMQMTLPGAPTLYYGDEAGQVGFTDPDNRRTFPWGREDLELIQFHKDLIHIHKSIDCLKYGSLSSMDYEDNYLSYGRFDHKDLVAVALNMSEEPLKKDIWVWELGVPADEDTQLEVIFTSGPEGHSISTQKVTAKKGILPMELGPKTGVLIRGKQRGK